MRSIKEVALSVVDSEYNGNIKLAPDYIQEICNYFMDELTKDESFIDMGDLLDDIVKEQAKDIKTVQDMNVALATTTEADAIDDVMTVLEEAGFDTELKRTPLLLVYNFYWYQPKNQIVYVYEVDDSLYASRI